MSKDQNIFDNDTFFESYKELRERDDNYNVLIEQPAMAKLLPDLVGKRVLDLGCGYGHNCVDFVKRGAEKVVGIDISAKMLDIAKIESSDEKIEYLQMSMTDIKSLGQTFDLIYSSLAFHYIEEFDGFMKDAFAVMNEGGCLLFSQMHPLVTATVDGKGHYNRDENGERVSYTFSDYSRSGKRKITWYVDGVIQYHRTFSDIINALADAGFVIDAVNEPIPDDRAIVKLPKLIAEKIKPTFIIVKAHK